MFPYETLVSWYCQARDDALVARTPAAFWMAGAVGVAGVVLFAVTAEERYAS